MTKKIETALRVAVRSLNIAIILYFAFISGRAAAIVRFNPNDHYAFTAASIVWSVAIALFIKGAIIKPSKSFACDKKKIVACGALICGMFSAIGVFSYVKHINGAIGTTGGIVLSTMIVLGAVSMLHIIPVFMYYTSGMKAVLKFRKGWESLWIPAEDEYSDDNNDNYDDNDHVGNTPLW